ncbi:MAG: ribosome-associated translation inhibitor RaiA [Solobacterium sp.]|nr:ribosome-associated translation inhibitor RaiA [Solobacterium sp.]MBQ9823788.1 ribosome-associated translation inhibitor RaiA [Solobacterium sp.]
MRFEIVGKNIEVSDAMKESIERKLSILDKYLLINSDTIARVVARIYPDSEKVEVTIPTKVGILRAEVVDRDFYAALDGAIDKLEDQIRRQKTRLSKKHREHLAKAFIEEAAIAENPENDIPVRTKTITADEMTLDDAIMQMELSGHTFYIYTDEESGRISVVYRRSSQGYGLIEVEPEE